MFPWHSTSGAGQPQGDGTTSKRRRSSVSSNTNAKRTRTIDSVQQTNNEGSGALKSPEASGQSENQYDSITDSPSSTSYIEDASFTSNTSLSTPSRCSSSNPTHDTSRASFHIKDLATFATTLEEAAKGAFPNRGRSRYAKVNVCLIRWEQDEAVQPELERLSNVFEHGYRFGVENWTIPTEKSHRKLMGKALDFIDDFDARDNLFIVYYAGHGTINENRQSVWCCTRDPKYASVDWSSIQSLFDDAISDVLILLDCCAAASSINKSGNGVNETIAACGFEGIAPPPGPHSFTNTLTEVLEDWRSRLHFSVSLLHSEVLFQLKRKRPEKGQEGTRIPGWCSTPVHYISSSDPRPQSIELCRVQVQDEHTINESPHYSPQLIKSGLPQSTPQQNQITPCTSTTPNGDLNVPHVLISVALEEEQADLNLESCWRWLTRFPALVKYAKVQGVFRSHSTLLLLSLPVAFWNMLPANNACSFVSFITSGNLACTMLRPAEQAATRAVIKAALESGAALERDQHIQTALNAGEKIANGATNPIQPEDDVHTRDDDSQKKALEMLKVIHELGYIVQKDPSHSRPANTELAASNRSENQVTCHTCKKFTGRPCELKKHMKRHERPYGCTFLTCNKTFGSKNDWKRHENSEHSLLEMWRCDEERPEGGPCAKLCYRRQIFNDHLVKAHQMSEDSAITSKGDKCRIGRNGQCRFWCGFCNKLVDLKNKGVEAWTERFDHIDDHFMGRHYLPKQSIADWVPMDSDRPKGEVRSPHSFGSPSSRGRTPSPHSLGSPNLAEDIVRSAVDNVGKAENKRRLKEKTNLLDQYQEIYEQSRLTLEPLTSQNEQLPPEHPYNNSEDSSLLNRLQASAKENLLSALAQVKVLAAGLAEDGEADAAEVAYTRALQTCRLAPLHGTDLHLELIQEVGFFYSNLGDNLQAEKQWRELLNLTQALPEALRDDVLQQLGHCVANSSLDLAKILRSTQIWRDIPPSINVPFPSHHRLLRCIPPTIPDFGPLRKPSIDRDIIGYPPIHSAIISKNIHVFGMIQFCSDGELLSKDMYQRSPLFLAALCKEESVGLRIMSRFSDRDTGIRERLMNDRDTLGHTILAISILSDCSLAFVLALLNNGAEPDPIPLEDTNSTPLKAAAMRGRSDVVDVLLRRGARDHLSPFGGPNPTALMHAQMRGHTTIVEQLTVAAQHQPT